MALSTVPLACLYNLRRQEATTLQDLRMLRLDLFCDLFSSLLLLSRMIEDGRAILRPSIGSLSVHLRWIMSPKEELDEFGIRNCKVRGSA